MNKQRQLEITEDLKVIMENALMVVLKRLLNGDKTVSGGVANNKYMMTFEFEERKTS